MSSDTAETVVIGIDGGGTGTRAAIVDVTGTILGIGIAGASNIQAVGREATARNIRDAIEAAWAATDGTQRPVAAIALGMAGVVSSIDREIIRRIAGELAPGAAIAVDHDLRSALHGGLAGAPGLVLIVGTGSSCYGRNQAGITARAGGWGFLMDDVGSAYWLGLQGLIATARAIDGRAEGTVLRARLFEALSLTDVNDLSHQVHSVLTRAEIAALAALVLECACDGDHAASAIVADGAEELALMAATVIERLDLQDWSVNIVASGGLIENNERYRALIAEKIAAKAPRAALVAPILPAVLGSVLIALELIGIPPEQSLIAHLRAGIAAMR